MADDDWHIAMRDFPFCSEAVFSFVKTLMKCRKKALHQKNDRMSSFLNLRGPLSSFCPLGWGYEGQTWPTFWNRVWSKILTKCWCLVEILKLMQGRDSEDVWSRFVFELVIWPKEVTLVSRTQPSGPLCLWQCFYMIQPTYRSLLDWSIPNKSLSVN